MKLLIHCRGMFMEKEYLGKTDFVLGEFSYNEKNFYPYLVLGQQVYEVLLNYYIFMFIGQGTGRAETFFYAIPIERMLESCANEFIGNKVWQDNNCGIRQKMRKSYVVLGLYYQKYGFDKTLLKFKKAVESNINEFLNLPIKDYVKFLNLYIEEKYNFNIDYSVEIEKKYLDNDLIYKASTFFLNKKIIEYGHNPKKSINNLARYIIYNLLDFDDFVEFAKSKNRSPMVPIEYYLENGLNDDFDETTLNFSTKYNIENSLVKYILFPDDINRSSNEKYRNILLMKKGMRKLGQRIFLLNILNYYFDSNRLDVLDLTKFDSCLSGIGIMSVNSNLRKTLLSFKCAEFLFDHIYNSKFEEYSQKQKCEMTNCFCAAFFVSNFSPEQKFKQIFYPLLEEFYTFHELEMNEDYKYSLTVFLSTFNLHIDSNNYQLDNGLYHEEISVWNDNESPKFVCEHSSKHIAHEVVFKQAYEELFLNFQKFFSTPNFEMDRKNFLFVMKMIVDSPYSNSELFKKFGALSTDNFNKIGKSNLKHIFQKANRYLNDESQYELLLNKLEQINNDKFILDGNYLYKYADVIKYSFCFDKTNLLAIELTKENINELYSLIVNPSESAQKALIDCDYKFVKKIYPILNNIAKYAIDTNIDAYNYIQNTTNVIDEYFNEKNKLTEQTEDINIEHIVSETNCGMSLRILDSHKPINTQIQELASTINIQHAIFACGYVFSSGLYMLKDILNRTIQNDIPVEFYVGALQNFEDSNEDNLITGIDKRTVNLLNCFLTNKNFSLFTCTDRFYHGKLYVFEGVDKTLICLGSSNISRAAFISNYELNIALTVDNNSEIKNKFDLWIKQLNDYSKQIYSLDESMFGKNEIKQDGSAVIKTISNSIIQQRIDELTNAEVKYRLNLWMSYYPDVISENLGILSLPNYIVFVYRKQKLLVLESFNAGNSYYCIKYENSFEDTINNISVLSKTEIFEFSQMTKRGYHTSSKLTLENNIKQYFAK